MTAVSIRDADNQIELLENQLIEHCVTALENKRVAAIVDGVFSLDSLEQKLETDLNGRIGVGVAYQGCKAISPEEGNASGDPHRAILNENLFVVILAVPTDQVATQRLDATELLTVLRKGILGKKVELSRGNQRTWGFVQEKPEIADSTPTMLYYSQVWRLLLPVIGN